MNSQNTHNAISSPASAAGRLHFSSPKWPTPRTSIPAHAPASPSPALESRWVSLIRAIYGRRSVALSASVGLQKSTASRLQASSDVNGSPEYSLTWRSWAMPGREPICALRASGRRTSGNDSTGSAARISSEAPLTGWPSPTVGNAMGSQMAKGASATGRRPDGSKATVSLNHVATLSGWPSPDTNAGGAATPELREKRKQQGKITTMRLSEAAQLSGWSSPRSSDSGRGSENRSERTKTGPTLTDLAQLTGWATPTARDHKDGSSDGTVETNALLGRQVWECGEIAKLSTAGTKNSGVLNPAHSRWLMGFPPGWDRCSPNFVSWDAVQSRLRELTATSDSRDTATPSILGLPQNSSPQQAHEPFITVKIRSM